MIAVLATRIVTFFSFLCVCILLCWGAVHLCPLSLEKVSLLSSYRRPAMSDKGVGRWWVSSGDAGWRWEKVRKGEGHGLHTLPGVVTWLIPFIAFYCLWCPWLTFTFRAVFWLVGLRSAGIWDLAWEWVLVTDLLSLLLQHHSLGWSPSKMPERACIFPRENCIWALRLRKEIPRPLTLYIVVTSTLGPRVEFGFCCSCYSLSHFSSSPQSNWLCSFFR